MYRPEEEDDRKDVLNWRSGDKNRNRYSGFDAESQLIEEATNRDMGKLAGKVGLIRGISEDIRRSIQVGVDEADQLQQGMNSASSLLKGTMNRLGSLQQTATTKHMFYLVIFVVFVFLVLYFIFL
eukprot:TRINITY_DN3725_c0_g1_i1.p1 TRINITY_DN3725_c0_g1~~TRINITY_DN3725_c0_g1_i1.p1  ORF type:complete len:125 (-),score=30.36 TRINITY_DN3725_c0_g1_i1:103-477(-)